VSWKNSVNFVEIDSSDPLCVGYLPVDAMVVTHFWMGSFDPHDVNYNFKIILLLLLKTLERSSATDRFMSKLSC